MRKVPPGIRTIPTCSGCSRALASTALLSNSTMLTSVFSGKGRLTDSDGPAGADPSAVPFPLFAAAGDASLGRLEGPLDTNRSTYLARRILLEGLEEPANQRDGGHHGPQFVTPPAAIQHRLVLITFPRIHPQVGHKGHVGRFLRAGEKVALDGLEAEFPVVVPNGREVAIVREVEEFLPR